MPGRFATASVPALPRSRADGDTTDRSLGRCCGELMTYIDASTDSLDDSSRVARRGFLARLSAAAAALTLTAAPSGLRAASSAAPMSQGDPDAWIARLTGRDRLLFHAHQQLMPAVMGARNVLANG